MKDYAAITYASRNSNGREEIQIEEWPSFLGWLLFNNKGKIRTYEKIAWNWYNVDTEKKVSPSKHWELEEIKNKIKNLNHV